MEILNWQTDQNIDETGEINYRTNFALSLKEKKPIEIVRELSFDGAAPTIEYADIAQLLGMVNRKFLQGNLSGIGLEAGAGSGIFSAVIAKDEAVRKVYAVEISDNVVKLLMPKVVRDVLGDKEEKVTGVIGDFDHIRLPDNSLDFVFDYLSLHHSSNLDTTLKELNRVLKKGGILVCFDKARPDNYTDEDINRMLDKEYGESYKKQFGLEAGVLLTRRMNGEREYRLKDWKRYFEQSGFINFQHYNLTKCQSNNLLNNFLQNIISVLPPILQAYITRLTARDIPGRLFAISSENRIYSRAVNPFPKEISLIIANK